MSQERKDWFIKKFTSRKFWAGVLAFVASVLTAFNVNDLTAQQVTVIISGIASLVIYIGAESYVDGKNAQSNTTSETYYKQVLTEDKTEDTIEEITTEEQNAE